MRLFKRTLFIALLFLLLFSLEVQAQVKNKTKTKPPGKAAVNHRFHLGLGYLQFNESMQISEGSSSSKGIANYAGPALSIEVSQPHPKSQFGILLLIAAGKAAAGSFDGDLSFDDAINRGWWSAQLQPYINWRVTRDFQIGGGPLAKLRVADWKPASSILNVQTTSAYSFGLQTSLRLNLSGRFSVTQSFGLLDFNGHNQWLFLADYHL